LAGNTSKPGATVASRLLAMIAAFDESHRNLALSDLARRAGLALPTAHRLAGELVAGGALQRNDDGRYMVGRLLWEAGLLAPVAGALRQVAEPFLHDVYAATLATVHLAVRDGDQVLYLERMMAAPRCPSSAAPAAGCRCTAPGWARCCSHMRPRMCRLEYLRT
jgi:DNA-binding IclR family transcriptional regulator